MYFVRSVWLRGPLNTLDFLMKELIYERRFGIKTNKMKLSNSSEFYHYQGASYKVLLKLFKDLVTDTRNFAFMDIGCGKGRALLVAEFCGYKQLTGIDLDEELVNAATENLKLYKFKRPDSEVRFICQNALSFDYPNEATVYFLFNPFNETVLKGVLERICSMNRKEVIFVYMNPLFPKPFSDLEIVQTKTYKSWRYTEAMVFRREKLNS